MTMTYQAAVLHEVQKPLSVEEVTLAKLGPRDVLVKVRAAGICQTDLEVINGSLRVPFPAVLGHEASGVVERVGPDARGVEVGDHVILSWNPHCGDCFYCDRSLPILCEDYLARTPQAQGFDGRPKAMLKDGRELHQLMFLGAFGEYCVVSDQQAIVVPKEIPFDRAALIGCGVMTGVGAAVNVSTLKPGGTALVIGCGAVGLAAVQGARMAGAEVVIAADLSDDRLDQAMAMGATHRINVTTTDLAEAVRAETGGRGVDTVLEAAGHPEAFRQTVESVRPGGEVIWLGKLDVNADVSFRWGSLMQEKRIRRASYGDARPRHDFPFLARAYLDGQLDLDGLITGRIGLNDINAGFDALRDGSAIRTVIEFEG